MNLSPSEPSFSNYTQPTPEDVLETLSYNAAETQPESLSPSSRSRYSPSRETSSQSELRGSDESEEDINELFGDVQNLSLHTLSHTTISPAISSAINHH